MPAEQRLAQSGAQSVWQATAEQIPHVLREIGRLRELSFRAANEGTGKSMDLDRFDDHYLHLFIWNAEAAEIVGAYRVGATDRILERHGRQGLYSSTLFDSRMEFFRRLGPALELGRSFVRPEYQRSYSPLLLLWKGIGSFIARHPRYRTLFGPVSISRDYSDLSRRLIATTLLAAQPSQRPRPDGQTETSGEPEAGSRPRVRLRVNARYVSRILKKCAR